MDPQSAEVMTQPVISSPAEYYIAFRESPEYRKAIDEFYQGKDLAADVTEDEKRETFERQDASREAFFSFAKLNTILDYDSSTVPPDTAEAVQDYLDQIRYLKKNEGHLDKESIRRHDHMRTMYHDALAESFAKHGIVPNARRGRDMAVVIAVNKGVESWGANSETNLQRQQRMLR